MKAVLLAAGLGSRLSPITDTIPKCMVSINGKPLLGYWLDTLVTLGITEILINLHYLPQLVRNFVATSPHRNLVSFVEEESLFGTAGTFLVNREFWRNQDTMVIHADNFCLSNLQGLIKQYQQRSSGIDATLLLFKTNNPRSCGVVDLNAQNVITGFYEKIVNPPSNLASGALFVFSPQVFDRYFLNLVPGKVYELSIDIVPKMIERLQGWKVDDYYVDIGTISALNEANQVMKTRCDRKT